MTSQGIGIQRMIQLFWDKDVDNTDLENPILVLGKEYKPDSSIVKNEIQPNEEGTSVDNPFDEIKNYFQTFSFVNQAQKRLENINIPWPKEFIDDINSKLWFTYRTQFKPLERDPDGPSPLTLKNFLRGQTNELNNEFFTTDCGWGCMIRTSQTLLANSLIRLKLGIDWKFYSNKENKEHDEVVKWFIDSPEYPFSIHKIVEKGKLLSDKKAGEWFGPSAASRSIQSLTNEFDCGLSVYIGSDAGDIYEKDLFKISKSNDDEFKPTLILLGVRLGVENINSIYWDSLKNILGSIESCGISGGRPSSSHYFFGYQGDYLFYLDPHYPQHSLEFDEDSQKVKSIETCHTKKIRKIHISEVDPSMLIGILIKNEDEWNNWKSKIKDSNTIIHISPGNLNSEMLNRRPSFVVYNEDGDDFVDIGYEDLVEEVDEEKNEYTEINEVGDTSIISIPESKANDFDTSFEHYTGEIKDDYEKIDQIESDINDSKTEIQEEPYVVEKSDINE